MSSKSKGEAQVMELKRRAESLCEQEDLQGDKKLEVQKMVQDTEQQWRTVLQAAEDTQRYRKMFTASRENLYLFFYLKYMSPAQLHIS